MALGTNQQTTTTAANFIPELWSDEVIAGYKANLVLGNIVTNINHNGKKGYTIHIPAPVRGSANAKAARSVVNLFCLPFSNSPIASYKSSSFTELLSSSISNIVSY